jgi:hypothetical protein
VICLAALLDNPDGGMLNKDRGAEYKGITLVLEKSKSLIFEKIRLG